MTAGRDKPLSFPANRDKLIARAIAADDGDVSVGGLASRIGVFRDAPDSELRSRPALTSHGIDALARLVQFIRRQQALTPEQFASRFSLDLRELVDLESARVVPEPRLLYQLSTALNVSYNKLLVLAGHRVRRDETLERETLRFAASSEPMDKLSKSEAQALHDFIRALHD